MTAVRAALYSVDTGQQTGWQQRDEDGRKTTKPGTKTKHAVFLADGEPFPDLGAASKVLLTEGNTDCQTVARWVKGRGLDAVVLGAVSAGTVPAVAERLNDLCREGTVLALCADNDRPGLTAAAQAYVAAPKLDCRIVLPSGREDEDMTDQIGERDLTGALTEPGVVFTLGGDPTCPLVERAEQYVKDCYRLKARKNPIKRGDHFRSRSYSVPPLRVGALRLREGLKGGMVGPPSSGKSAVALAAALEMARLPAGQEGEFGEEPIVGGCVLWIASEGEHSLPGRVAAWQELRDPEAFRTRTWPEQFGVITAADARDYGPGNTEFREEHLDRLVSQCEASGFYPRLVVLDTLAASLSQSGLEENSQSGMGSVDDWKQLVISKFQFGFEYGPAVLAVHHTGKDQDRGPRGHSSYHAALDVEIRVRNDAVEGAEFANEAKVFFSKNRYGDASGMSLFVLEGGGWEDPQTGRPSGVRAVYQQRFGRR